MHILSYQVLMVCMLACVWNHRFVMHESYRVQSHVRMYDLVLMSPFFVPLHVGWQPDLKHQESRNIKLTAARGWNPTTPQWSRYPVRAGTPSP